MLPNARKDMKECIRSNYV